ncbi:PilZ domain-containing protein [Vibrio sinensis]|uniref:PilZ domain-containing protein n=1 Tax=Vibrio sinensis TaxID=2302434 RepID=A0A3A6QGA4_9VIBR|nr:PilZ domain-containing protein [Vibrio sinensis]RJX71910.1 PilZ domain-containing protein [Vibrio sinensis]
MSDQEFFTVNHSMAINIEPLSDDFTLPSYPEFEAEIPLPFIVASEFSQLEQLNDSAHAELRKGEFKQLVTLLDTQNAKLNLLLTFMLSQQDDASHRFQTTAFGASQFTFRSSNSLNEGHLVRAKLFLEQPAAAIYCYGRVANCQVDDNQFLITVKYERLREVDQDLLIKAALMQQQKLLRQRSLNRDK